MSIVRQTDDRPAIDLMALARVLLRKLHFIILWMIVCGIAAYAAVFFLVTPTYRASVTMYVNNSTRTDTTNISSADLYTSARLVDTYAAIIVSNTVTEAVAEEANIGISAGALASSITVSSVNETEVFTVSVVNTDPDTAARLANTIAEVATDRISEIVKGSTVSVIDYAKTPKSIDSPSYIRSAQVGALLGLLLSVAFFAIRALLDNSIHGSEDMEQWDYPLLATIPDLEVAETSRSGYGYGNRSNRAKT